MAKKRYDWRLIVVLSDGCNRRDILAAWTRGWDIFAAVPGAHSKTDYHHSGVRQTKLLTDNSYAAVRRIERPQDLQGLERLHQVRFRNNPPFFLRTARFSGRIRRGVAA